ncbi:MAG TPA: M36 family metallopeptidase [Gaiellaceae bacterium]|nr:M36 family metallopeptidase [Gaiellaceae bacterium]
MSKTLWTLCALVAATALVISPGAMSSSSGATADDDALATARGYLEAGAADLGVTSADVADVFVMSKVVSKHNGVTHFNFNQRFRGLEVFGGHATVSINAQGELVFASGSLVSLGGAADAADLSAIDAVEAAADGLNLADPSGLTILSGAASAEALVSRGGISNTAIPAKLGWQPTANGLKLVWRVEIDDSSSISIWNAAVDADTGELIDAVDLTIEDEHEDLAATVSGGSLPAPPLVTPDARGFSLNRVNDGSSYRVYDIALESPNDGARRLVQNPADATASPFGWHDTNGVVGPEFTITRGNNTHTFLEQDDDQLPDFGGSPDGGAGLDFDFPADLTQHAQAYRDAVVTNEFFGCNTFHDLLYLYGFDENADNFQFMDYNGGPWSNGDYVRCHVASGAGTNNANFGTPTVGGAPRMRMYLWPGNQLGSQNEVVVAGVGNFGAGWARYGPPATNAGTSGPIFNAGNGCVAADYTGIPAGAIAIAVGGNAGCQNIAKTHAANAAGANALILSSGTSNTTVLESNEGGMLVASPTIPAVSVSTANGDAIRAAVGANATVRKNPAHPGIRDGDFENGIIFHEYGHGLSNRLTGGPGISCLGGAEQMGEGWSDYVAITSFLDPDLDDPNQPRGMGPYALFQADRHGNGIRPRPYSRDFNIQPTTYDSIKTNAWLTGSLAQPHGIGHAWAAILWDMNWDLIDKYGFSGNIYLPWNAGGNNRAMQYMVDGLKLQGCSPTFVSGRAAIIAAANVLGGGAAGEVKGDACTLWATFSRRGLGFSAVGGLATSRDDGTEAFDTNPLCLRGFLSPVVQPYGSLNDVDAGDAVPLRFTADGYTQLDVLKDSGSPFSRKVDCATLRVPSQGARITPREFPVDTVTPGNSTLTVNPQGVFHYNWKTLEEWTGTCRELVLTRDDGKQHRAFFRFL